MRHELTPANIGEYRAANARCPHRAETRALFGPAGERACPSCRHMLRLCDAWDVHVAEIVALRARLATHE